MPVKTAGFRRLKRLSDSINRKTTAAMGEFAKKFSDRVPTMDEVAQHWAEHGAKYRGHTDAITRAGMKYQRRMDKMKVSAFVSAVEDELQKEAGLGEWASKNKEHLVHGAELAGLSTLAVPSVHKLKKIHAKDTPPEERKAAKYELAGLGILAAPSALHLAHSAYKKFKKTAAPLPNAVVGRRSMLLKAVGQASSSRPPPKPKTAIDLPRQTSTTPFVVQHGASQYWG